MSETPVSESAEEMRLIDHVAFKKVTDGFNRATGPAPERLKRLRHALRQIKVIPGLLNSQERLTVLYEGILSVYALDLNRDDEKWCEHGFRHRLSDGQYSSGSTVSILIGLHSLHFGVYREDTSAAWNVNKALWNLAWHIEEVAALMDHVFHNINYSPRQPIDWPQSTFPWSVDILTSVILESTLKSLWVIRHPKGNPKTEIGHRYRDIWDALQDDHAAIIDHATWLPIMFKCLRSPESIEEEVRWAFRIMSDNEWVETRYWYTSDWGTARVALPYHKFLISLAVYCVATKAVIGRL